MSATAAPQITYSLRHTLILTRRCAYACGYCDYPAAPSRPLPSIRAVERSLSRARTSGVIQLRISAGEGIADHPETISIVRYYGLRDYTDYLGTICRRIVEYSPGRTMLPVPEVGNLSLAQLKALRGLAPCVKILMESSDPMLMYAPAHAQADCKSPDRRLDAILEAGRAEMPLTTGILVGIGESRDSREKTLRLLAEAHRRYAHVQNISIEPFQPRPGTPMEASPPTTPAELWDAVGMARRVFGSSMPITCPVLDEPALFGDALEAGVNDFGDLEVKGSAREDVETLRRIGLAQTLLASRGLELRERLPVFPSNQSGKWLPPSLLHAALRALVTVAEQA